MAHPIRPESYIKMDNFYTLTVYEKGAPCRLPFVLVLQQVGNWRGLRWCCLGCRCMGAQSSRGLLARRAGRPLPCSLPTTLTPPPPLVLPTPGSALMQARR